MKPAIPQHALRPHRLAALALALLLLILAQPVTAMPPAQRPDAPGGRPALIPPFDLDAGVKATCGYGCGGHTDGRERQGYFVDFKLGEQSFTVRAAAGGWLSWTEVIGLAPDGSRRGTAVNAYIEHDNGWKTSYGHLAEGSVVAPNGQRLEKGARVRVNAGDKIAMAGRSGADNVHLHFGLYGKTKDVEWSYPIPDILNYATPATATRRGESGLELRFVNYTPGAGRAPFTALTIKGTNHEGKPATWEWRQFGPDSWAHTIEGWWWKGPMTITFTGGSCTVTIPAKGRSPAVVTFIKGENRCEVRS